MKHGTRGTPIATVAGCDVGIDFRFTGEKRLFGRAAYTAEDGAYVDGGYYSVDPASGGRQMFLVRVAAGRVYDAPAVNTALVRPPEGFDSVRGQVAAPFFAIMAYSLGQVRQWEGSATRGSYA